MKPQFLKVHTGSSYSFSVRQDKAPNINNRWHYHEELELIHFHKGCGMQFVGDHIKHFCAGDIVLVGSNLSHYWRYDDACVTGQEDEDVYSTVIHFTEKFWGQSFLDLPELLSIKLLLDKAKRGISLREDSSPAVALAIRAVYESGGVQRIVQLLEALSAISAATDYQLLASMGFKNDFSTSESDRLNSIYKYTVTNFKKQIYLGTISSEAQLVPNSFCRYFKSRTGKTYSRFLNEIRIGYACKLLIENRSCNKEICYESGFSNYSCFYKNFKEITGKTPEVYKKDLLR